MADENTPWFDGLDEDLKSHIVSKGLDKLDPTAAARKAVEMHRGAEKLIGADPSSLAKLPKDAADPNYAPLYERLANMAVPKEPAGYTFEGVKFKDGAEVPDTFANMIRETATELKLSPSAAKSLAARMVAYVDKVDMDEGEAGKAALAASQTELRQTWGSNYDLNLFKIQRVSEMLGWDRAVTDTLNNTVGGTKVMSGLLELANRMGEAEYLKGSPSGGSMALTRDQALEKKVSLMMEAGRGKLSEQRLAEVTTELLNLDKVILGASQQR